MDTAPTCIDGCGKAVSKKTRRCDVCWLSRPGKHHACPTCGSQIHVRQKMCERHWMDRKAGVVGRPRPRISAKLRQEVLDRDGRKCTECGATEAEAKLVLDHAVSHASGGATSAENLVTLCASCNRAKWF